MADEMMTEEPMAPVGNEGLEVSPVEGMTEEQPNEFNQIMVDAEIVKNVMECYEASKEWQEPYRQIWDEVTDNYEQVYDATGKETWQATTFQPVTTTVVERAVASLHNMSMGPDMPVAFKERNGVDAQRIDATNEILEHDLEKNKFKVHWTDFLRSLALYGTAIGKCGYAKEEATILVKERRRNVLGGMFGAIGQFFGMGQQQQEMETMTPKNVLVKDYATFKNVDIYKIFPQPYTDDFCKDNWVVEKFEITNKELIDGAMSEDEYNRFENITPELLMSGQSTKREDSEEQWRNEAQNQREVALPAIDPNLKHEGYEFWGPVPKWYFRPELRNDEVARYQVEYAWLTVIDGRWLVRKQLNIYRDAAPPYVKGNFIKRLGQFYGIGLGELVKELQSEKNEIRNTRQDNINIMLNKIAAILKDKVSPDEMSRLVSAPGAIWPFEHIDDVRKAVAFIDIPDITGDAWRASAEVDREIQEVTDVIKSTQTIGSGKDQAGNDTFRGQLLNQQQANERFILYARIIESLALDSAIFKIYQMIYQFKTYTEIDKILGQKAQGFELVPPEEIMEIAGLISLGALTNENKGLAFAKMRDFYGMFANEPFIKKLEYARLMYRLGDLGSNPDEVLWSDQEMQQFNEAKRQLIAQASSMPGMGGMPPEMGAPPPQMGPEAAPVAAGGPQSINGLRPPIPPQGPGGMGRPIS